MRKLITAFCLATFCGAVLVASPASSAPLSVAIPLEDGVASVMLAKYGPPEGKKCLKWTRRYGPTHGFGHRRCAHWK